MKKIVPFEETLSFDQDKISFRLNSEREENNLLLSIVENGNPNVFNFEVRKSLYNSLQERCSNNTINMDDVDFKFHLLNGTDGIMNVVIDGTQYSFQLNNPATAVLLRSVDLSIDWDVIDTEDGVREFYYEQNGKKEKWSFSDITIDEENEAVKLSVGSDLVIVNTLPYHIYTDLIHEFKSLN